MKSILGQALEIESPAERSAFLSAACAADPSLRAEVEGLLRAVTGTGDFMKGPALPDSITTSYAPISEGPGTKIGPYRLLQQLGEGGMGVVYMAEQELPVRRKVALKIIKPGMDSAQVVARFEAERQALAVMDHTNIARVFDAGTTESGRPYFVMELVHGVPITSYCDDNRLTPRERLELFVPVCRAIQHAHQKGIIHRDVKPSNVLVTIYDDRPVPKVIDFGVAKAVEQRLTSKTLFTQYGALVGTFEYMSPEQAEMNAFGVDTRSDVYSLGVLLYELLTGTTPLERSRLREAAFGELLRLIKEVEPPRPSVRLSSSGDLPRIAAARKTEPARLPKILRGEVDWIVMKCLEKDRTRRYDTAIGLARDIERYLKDEPVEAYPPTLGYRMRKFAVKHRAAILAIGACFLLMTLGAVSSLMLARQARQAEHVAQVQQRLAVENAIRARDSANAAQDSVMVARAERDRAEAAQETLRRSLYASDLQLAHAAWNSGNALRMQELLEGQKPRPGEADLRGFEWNYLRRLGSILRTVKVGQGATWGGVSPDGTRFVLPRFKSVHGGQTGDALLLQFWDLSSGVVERTVTPFPDESILSLGFPDNFSGDGKRFAYWAFLRDAAGREHTLIKVWEWGRDRELCALIDLPSYCGGTTIDRAGKRLSAAVHRTSGEAGSDMKVWAVDGGKELLTIPQPGQWPRQIVFSLDGSHLAALTQAVGRTEPDTKLEIRVWETGTGKELSQFATESGSSSLEYSPDGKRLAIACDGTASIWLHDSSSGKRILELTRTGNIDRSGRAAFSPDGSRLAIGSSDGKVRIWDVSGESQAGPRAPARILESYDCQFRDVAFSADGRSLSAAGFATVLTWDVAIPREQAIIKVPGSPKSISPTLATAADRFGAAIEDMNGSTEVKVWNRAGEVLFTAKDTALQGRIQSHRDARLSRDGSRMAYAAFDSLGIVDGQRKEVCRLRVWDVAQSRELLTRESNEGQFIPSDFSPDGRLLATTWVRAANPSPERPPWISVWDLGVGKELLHLEVLTRLVIAAFSPDGRQLAMSLSPGAGEDAPGELRVCEATTGKVIMTRKWSQAQLGIPEYSGDGRLLAVAVSDGPEPGGVKILDAISGQVQYSLAGHRYQVGQLVFSPDGSRLASSASFPGRTEAEVKLWDLASGRELLTLQATGEGSLAFSPDGRRLTYFSTIGSSTVGEHCAARVQVWDATPLPDDGPAASP